jgi:hypothetical protein
MERITFDEGVAYLLLLIDCNNRKVLPLYSAFHLFEERFSVFNAIGRDTPANKEPFVQKSETAESLKTRQSHFALF